MELSLVVAFPVPEEFSGTMTITGVVTFSGIVTFSGTVIFSDFSVLLRAPSFDAVLTCARAWEALFNVVLFVVVLFIVVPFIVVLFVGVLFCVAMVAWTGTATIAAMRTRRPVK